MRAGQLRHRIVIERAVTTQNEYGELVETWSKVKEAWASREDLSGREYFAANQVNAEVTTEFRMRYASGICSGMRINSDSTLYDIQSVQDATGKSREVIISAKKGTAASVRTGPKRIIGEIQ